VTVLAIFLWKTFSTHSCVDPLNHQLLVAFSEVINIRKVVVDNGIPYQVFCPPLRLLIFYFSLLFSTFWR